MAKEIKIVKGFFGEEEFKKFTDVEKLIKEGMPSFQDAFEKEIIKKISHKNSKGEFYIKSVIAASLLILVFAYSFFFFKPPLKMEKTSVSSENIKEVLLSVGGRDELRIDEILSIIETNIKDNSKNYEIYLEYYLGENDEESFS